MKPKPIPLWIIVDPDTGYPKTGHAERSELAAKLVNHQMREPLGEVVRYIPAPQPKRRKRGKQV